MKWKLEHTRVNCDEFISSCSPHAYVTVADRDTAETAALNLNDTYFNGRIIAVVPLPKNCEWLIALPALRLVYIYLLLKAIGKSG